MKVPHLDFNLAPILKQNENNRSYYFILLLPCLSLVQVPGGFSSFLIFSLSEAAFHFNDQCYSFQNEQNITLSHFF
jgi:hypothetical protein